MARRVWTQLGIEFSRTGISRLGVGVGVLWIALLGIAVAAPASDPPEGGGLEVEVPVEAPPVGPLGTAPRSHLEEAWFGGGADLGARATRVRLAALELGVENVESAARALISPDAAEYDSGSPLGRALLATRLAPDLPTAYVGLAQAQWEDGEHAAAVRSVFEGILAIPRHLEASFWLVSSLGVMLAVVMVLGSLAFISMVGLSVLSPAAHDLGDLVSSRMPLFARAALLGTLLLVPLLLGEGILGAVLGLFLLAVIYRGSQHRVALALAAVLVIIGMYPVTQITGAALYALDSDSIANSVLSVVRGTENEADLERLQAADDGMARHALAVRARRLGNAEEASERYGALSVEFPRDSVILTNLANLRFRQGELDSATDLYERAAGSRSSAIGMFNLSQAYARGFRMEEFEQALQRAQAVDPDTVAELSRVADPDFVADVPFPLSEIRTRLIASSAGDAFAEALSRPIAPGLLGRGWLYSAVGFLIAAFVGLLLAPRYEHSSDCGRCGARICARCDGTVWNSEICDSCHRLFHRPETTDATLRMARLTDLRVREIRRDRIAMASSLLIPGSGGLLARRPDLAFVGILTATFAGVCVLWRHGVVVDPLAVGVAGSVAFLLLGASALFAYLGVVGAGLLIRRSF